MILHLIRHGTTTTSGSTYAGRSDVPLTAEGRRMAQDLARELSALPITLVVCSPLGRAVDTATPLAATLGVELRMDPLLLEIDFGTCEGFSKRALGLNLRKSHAIDPIPGGESLDDVWRRAGRFLGALEARHGTQDLEVAVVGHFWINRMIFGRIAGHDFDTACRARDYRPRTGSVVTLRTPCPAAAGDLRTSA